jgi:hypothetical protein
MNKITVLGVLVLATISSGCTTSRIAQTTWAQDPPPRAIDSRTTPPQSPPPRDRVVVVDRDRAWAEDRRHKPWEFTLTGSGTNDEDFDIGNGIFNGSAGYYFNEVLELSVRQGVFFSDDQPVGGSTSTEDVWNFQTRIALDLHFPIGAFVPYVGANVGYIYGDSDGPDDTLAAGPEAGVKIYLKSDAFLQVGAEWEFFEDRGTALEGSFEDSFDQGQIFYFAGFGLRF